MYDNFTGPNRIVVTDDPDFALSHPELAHMVILSIAEFKPMAEALQTIICVMRSEKYIDTAIITMAKVTMKTELMKNVRF